MVAGAVGGWDGWGGLEGEENAGCVWEGGGVAEAKVVVVVRGGMARSLVWRRWGTRGVWWEESKGCCEEGCWGMAGEKINSWLEQ